MITHHFYGDESGHVASMPYLVIGCVKTSEPDKLEAELDAICQAHASPGEIKYCSTNRQTLAVRREFIDLFFSLPSAEFRCVVKAKACHSLQYFRGNSLGMDPEDLAYNFTYKQLLEHNILPNERVLVFLDDKSRTRKDNLFEYLRSVIPPVADAQPLNSKTSRIVQLADLLAGSVFGDLTGNRHPVKCQAPDYILNHLGRKDFHSKVPGDKFNVWHWQAKRGPMTT